MNEFQNIKMRIKMAIMMEPTISLKIQHDYCDMLENCNSMEQIPEELKRFVKIVLTEMREEQEEIEESNKEREPIMSIDEVISSIDKTINDIQNGNNVYTEEQIQNKVENYQQQANQLFDYIDENEKVKIQEEFTPKVRKYDWKRDLRSGLASLIIALNDDNYNTVYVKDKNNNDVLLYVKNITELQEIFEKYNLYIVLDYDKERLANEYLNQRLLDLSEEKLMLCLSYLLEKSKQDLSIIDKYLGNRILVRLATLLYNHLYNLI